MSWYATWETVARAAAVLFVPGLLVGLALGLRRWWLVAVAPGISVGVVGTLAVLFGAAGVPWGLPAVGAGSLVVAGAAWAVSTALRPWWGVDRARVGWGPFTAIGLVAAAGLAALAMKRGMGVPDAPAQTWDAVFHLNALRFVLDTENASSLHVGLLAYPLRDASLYPAGWHAVTSLAVTDTTIEAANVVAIIIAAVLVPLGFALLASTLVPGSRWLPGITAVVSTCFVAFPARMLSFGTLWPNALGYALIPVALALTVRALDGVGVRRGAPGAPDPAAGAGASGSDEVGPDEVGPDEVGPDDGARPQVRRLPLAAALVVTLVGTVLAHPNAFLGYLVLAGPFVVLVVVRSLVTMVRERRVVGAVVLGAGILVTVGVAAALLTSPQARAVAAYERPSYLPAWDGVLQALTDTQLSGSGWNGEHASWVVAGLTLLGFVTALVVRRLRWVAVSYVVTLLFFVAAVDQSVPFAMISGPWYGDAVRLGGLVVVAAVPVVAFGAWTILRGLLALVARVPQPRRGTSRAWASVAQASVALVAVGVLVVGTSGARLDQRTYQIWSEYTWSDDPGWPGLFTGGEIELFERMSDELPDDALVVGSPFSGLPLAYSVGGVDVVFPHFQGGWPADARYLGAHMSAIDEDPEVCAAVERLGVTHLYVDGQVYWPTHHVQAEYAGLAFDPATVDGFTLVDSVDSARLFSVDAC